MQTYRPGENSVSPVVNSFTFPLFISLILVSITLQQCSAGEALQQPIDRQALVLRHNPSVSEFDSLSSFTVGNGNFAFTVDATGLQTFREHYEMGVPLGTQSNWGWHSFPDTLDARLSDTFEYFNTYGRDVPYASDTRSDTASWLRSNPHKLHLGQVGFLLYDKSGQEINKDQITSIEQTLDLWSGHINSTFQVSEMPVQTTTAAHPQLDMITARVQSDLMQSDQLAFQLIFPYGSSSWGKQTGDWDSPEKHESVVISETPNSIILERILNDTRYYVAVQWQGEADWVRDALHTFHLRPGKNSSFAFRVQFSQTEPELPMPDAEETLQASAEAWKSYWSRGGAIDLSSSTAPEANELERRIVLSQYLMRVQASGTLPPQETGLTCNSWHGKFHLEMHWWHGVHHLLWGRPDLFQRSLDWYIHALPQAKGKAERQGYKGARWPKMVGPDGRESPSGVGVFLIWQQPHSLYYLELLYSIAPGNALLKKYQDVVFETASFMADYAHWNESAGQYDLGPPLIPAQEIYPPDSTRNPAFELSYWRYGLEIAQQWRQRLGMDRHEEWDHVIENLAPLPESDGLYVNAANAPETFIEPSHREDHPTLLGAFGMLPNPHADPVQMRRTLHEVMQSWNWEDTWGWDYPLTAMTAARVGAPEVAIEALLMDVQKNTYLNNGHNYQDDRLTLYLPGNGGLLSAVAMMAAGWDGAPDTHAPGFPQSDEWTIRWEGLKPLP